jgi:hypothetical protein
MRNSRAHFAAVGLLQLNLALALSCGVGSTSPSSVSGAQQTTMITVTGRLQCLPHRPGFTTTFECTIGLREDDGRYYALLNLKSDATVGDRVRVTGRFTPGPRDPYDVVGTIDVSSQEPVSGALRNRD